MTTVVDNMMAVSPRDVVGPPSSLFDFRRIHLAFSVLANYFLSSPKASVLDLCRLRFVQSYPNEVSELLAISPDADWHTLNNFTHHRWHFGVEE